jgi:hypothetical protein
LVDERVAGGQGRRLQRESFVAASGFDPGRRTVILVTKTATPADRWMVAASADNWMSVSLNP